MVMQFIPAHRCVELLESLTGATPSVGFVHGMLARASGLLAAADKRIRALITLAYAVSCDETPLKVGPRTPKPGKKKAEKYLLVASTELYTHYLLGDRDLDTFTAFVFTDLIDSVIVHDRYCNYDSTVLGGLTHQLCCQHLLRDLAGASEVYPDEHWPSQITDALRELIHEANLAREEGRDAIADHVKTKLVKKFSDGVLVGLSATTSHGTRPGERKARLLLEVFRDRAADVLRFAHDLKVPPTSNQAERDLRPSKVQQNISGRLTSEKRTQDRYTIRGYLSTAAKHGLNIMDTLHTAILGNLWAQRGEHLLDQLVFRDPVRLETSVEHRMRAQFDQHAACVCGYAPFPSPRPVPGRPNWASFSVVSGTVNVVPSRDQPPLPIPGTLCIRTRDRLYHLTDDRLHSIGTQPTTSVPDRFSRRTEEASAPRPKAFIRISSPTGTTLAETGTEPKRNRTPTEPATSGHAVPAPRTDRSHDPPTRPETSEPAHPPPPGRPSFGQSTIHLKIHKREATGASK